MKQVSNLKQKLPLVEEKQEKNIFFEIERLDLWETLKVIHVNDSRDPFASGRDRHENLGDGSLGSEPLRDFLSHEKIRALPLILEVPGMDHKSGPDAVNVQRLQNLCQ